MKPSKNIIKIILTITILVGALGYLFASSLNDNMQYFKHVDDVIANPQPLMGITLRLAGTVEKNSILQKPDTLQYRFHLERNGKKMEVRYEGIVPDTFKDEAQVIAVGKLNGTEYFQANEIIAKCPSKYEADAKAQKKY